jgi:catechol 2,3-dioxygenase-like lactoylglutathione lyase family enzyme
MTAMDPRAQIGHVHLKVADLDRAVSFYRDALGFEEQGRIGSVGRSSPRPTLTTTSRSTRGRAKEASRRRAEARACITSASATRPALRWRAPCGA